MKGSARAEPSRTATVDEDESDRMIRRMLSWLTKGSQEPLLQNCGAICRTKACGPQNLGG